MTDIGTEELGHLEMVAGQGSVQAEFNRELTAREQKKIYETVKMTLKLIVRQPLALTGTTEKFDIVCTVAGGGVTGQAGAIRHGLSR